MNRRDNRPEQDRVDLLITSLGAPRFGYEETTYVWPETGVTHTTRFSPVAVAQRYRPPRTCLLLTEFAAAGKTGAAINVELLTAELAALGSEVVPVAIPNDAGEAALWTLFQRIVEHTPPGSRIIFDVTYGFRYIPMLALLAGQFLSVVHGIDTVAIVYGARDALDDQGRAPLLRLDPFRELMTWTQATAHFVETGNAGQIVETLELEEHGSLADTRGALHDVSRTLRLGHARDVGGSVAYLSTLLDRPVPQTSGPLGDLFATIERKYQPLALPDDKGDESANRLLRQQAALLGWYVENQLALQAVLLAREWLVTYVADQRGAGRLFRKDVRDDAETFLRSATYAGDADHRQNRATLRRMPDGARIGDLWSRCFDLRNELAHMGMRERLRTPAEIMTELRTIDTELQAVAARIPPPPEQALRDENFWPDVN